MSMWPSFRKPSTGVVKLLSKATLHTLAIVRKMATDVEDSLHTSETTYKGKYHISTAIQLTPLNPQYGTATKNSLSTISTAHPGTLLNSQTPQPLSQKQYWPAILMDTHLFGAMLTQIAPGRKLKNFAIPQIYASYRMKIPHLPFYTDVMAHSIGQT